MRRKLLNVLVKGPGLTPRGLLLRAALLAATFLLLHLAGGRAYAGVLCGMHLSPGGIDPKALLGLVYVIAYLGCVVIAPILVLAAALLLLWQLATRTSR